MKISALFMLLALISGPACAEELYKIVHPDGSIEFTDDPNKPGAEPITVQKLPTYKQRPVTTPPAVEPKQAVKEKTVSYTRLEIASPAQDETVFFNENGMSISIGIEPDLAEGHVIELVVDGSVVASGQQKSFTVKDIYRGTHTVSARVVDKQGSTVKTASTVTFYMRQHSIIKPK